MIEETWRMLVFPPFMTHTYEISSYGNVRYKPTGHILDKIYHSTNGYDYVSLMLDPTYAEQFSYVNKNTKMMKIKLDYLVASLFVTIPHMTYTNTTVRHIDGDTHNCHADNLEWVCAEDEWRVVDYSDIVGNMYAVSSNGDVRKLMSTKILDTGIDNEGDVVVLLDICNGGRKGFKVHNLVTHAFYGKRNRNEIVNHVNGVKRNCRIDNLEYIDYTENINNGIADGSLEPNTGKKQKIDVDTMDMVRELLFKHGGSVRLTLKDIDKDEYPLLDRRLVDRIRNGGDGMYGKSNKYSDEELKTLSKMRTSKPRIEITDEVESTIVGLLFKHHGDVKAVCEDPTCKASSSIVYQIKNKCGYKF